MKWVQEKTWLNHDPSNSSFIYPSNKFINNPYRGIEYVKREIVPYLEGGEVAVSDEAIYKVFPNIEELKNKKFLVVGGGPTTNDVEWSSKEYDYIFTCNHYYKNEKLKTIEPYMVFLGDEVDLKNNELNNILSSNNTKICFENIGRSKQDLINIKEIYKNRVTWAHTRYHSKIGAVTRIVSFLCCLIPISIDIVGMDGYIPRDKQLKYFHSFQKNKNQTGSIENLSKEESIIAKYKQQYLEFWDYILHDIGKNILFKNLGHGHPCNLSTQVLAEKLGESYQEYLLDPNKRV